MRLRGAARLAALLTGCALFTAPAPALAAPAAVPAAAVPAPFVVESHGGGDGMPAAGTERGLVAHLFDATDAPVPGQQLRLESRPAAGGDWTPVALATTDAHGAANFTVAPATSTVYVARHVGSLAAGRELTYLTGPAPSPPEPPFRSFVDPADGAAHAVWTPPAHDGGSPVTGYAVTARPADRAGPLTTVRVGPDAREATVTGLTNGATYDVRVSAVNAHGEVGYDLRVTPSATAPPWPREQTGGTAVCGRLPFGTTTWTAAGSPYQVCRLGVVVPIGSTLEVTGAEVRFTESPRTEYRRTRDGLTVAGGGVRITDSVLRGAAGRPGEWGGITVDEIHALPWSWPPRDRTSGTLSVARSEVRHAVDAVWVPARASYLDVSDTLLADTSAAGLRVDGMPVRAARVSVRDAGGDGISLTCHPSGSAPPACPVRLDGATVERAAGRGLLVDTPGPAAVRGVVVTGSGTRAPVSEAARITGLTGSYGAGGDVEDVTGGGNAVNAVLLDMTHTRDLVWRTPVAGAATAAGAPAPLGFLAGRVAMAPGRSVAFPPGSVVKAVEALPARPECFPAHFVPECRATVAVTDGALDAAAGTVFTSAHDATAGITTCPSAFATACGTGTSWIGLSVHGSRATARLDGTTVRHARTGLAVGTPTPADGPGPVVTLTGTTFAAGGTGLLAQGSYGDPLGSLTATDVTVEGPSRSSLVAARFATLTLRRVTVRDAPEGVRLDGSDGSEPCVRRSAVTVDGLVVENVRRRPVELLGMCHPRVRGVTVRGSGPAGAGDVVAEPAVDLRGTYSVGPDRDVHGFAGGGNGMDAVSLSGTVEGDMTWVSPRNAAADHPLGYVVGPGPENLTVQGGTVTVPAGGLVASLGVFGYANANGLLTLRGASLDASAGGARFVSARDPLAAELGCRPCATTPWAGIRALGPTEPEPGGSIRLHAATIRGGFVRTASPTPVFSLTQSSSDQPVHVTRPDRLTVTDSRLAQLNGGAALHADVSRNTFTGPYTGVVLAGRGRTSPSDIVLRDNVADGSITGPAYVLGNAHVRLGAAGTVHGNLGSGDSAALLLAGVTTAHDLAWLTPTNEPHPHPVGYVAAGYPVAMPDPLTVEGPRTLTLPAGGVMKVEGTVLLRGARFDASAGGALVTPTYDGSAGVGCGTGWRAECQDPDARYVPGVVRIESEPDPATGKAGGVALRGARVHGKVWVEGPAGDAPGFPGYALAVVSSYVGDGIHAQNAATVLSRSRIRNAGAGLHVANRPHVVRDTTFEDIGATGLEVIAADAVVAESAFVRTATAHLETSALQVWNGAVTLSCLDVRGNGNGLLAHGQTSFAVSDSALTGNTGVRPETYDLDNKVRVTTTRVWWGQPGGPKAGQVRDRSRHADVSPAAAKPACAVAETATPPSAPRSVTATGSDNAITAEWVAPIDDGGQPVSEYRVTVSPTGATRYVPGAARGVTIGVAPGTTYAVTVTAVTAAGAGPPSRHSLPVHAGVAGEPPAPATLSASAPALVTYGTDAVVTGTLATAQGPLPGRLVHLHVRRAGAAAWGPPVATLVTSPAGTVARAVRPAANSEVMLAFAGDATALAATSAARRVDVRPVVTAAFSRASTTLGSSVTLSGRVAPVLAGRPVRLERYTAYGWMGVTRAYLTSTSTYRFTVKPPKRGTLHYRVVYEATATHARAVSPTRTIKVG